MLVTVCPDFAKIPVLKTGGGAEEYIVNRRMETGGQSRGCERPLDRAWSGKRRPDRTAALVSNGREQKILGKAKEHCLSW